MRAKRDKDIADLTDTGLCHAHTRISGAYLGRLLLTDSAETTSIRFPLFVTKKASYCLLVHIINLIFINGMTFLTP